MKTTESSYALSDQESHERSASAVREAMQAGDYKTAMRLRSEMLGLDPTVNVYGLGLRTTGQLSDGDSRKHMHAFDIGNPQLGQRLDIEARSRTGGRDYAALRESAADPGNLIRLQAQQFVDEVVATAQGGYLEQRTWKVGTAPILEVQLPQGGTAFNMAVYLPDGDVAYGRPTPENVAALREANYAVGVVDQMGEPVPGFDLFDQPPQMV